MIASRHQQQFESEIQPPTCHTMTNFAIRPGSWRDINSVDSLAFQDGTSGIERDTRPRRGGSNVLTFIN